MSVRIAFATLLLVLYGLVTIPSASGISCYEQDCSYFVGQDPFCRGQGMIECADPEDDSCVNLNVTLGPNGDKFTIWNCSRTTHDDCDQQATCDYMRELASDNDYTIQSCKLSCCETSECNVPDSEEQKDHEEKKHEKALKTFSKKFYWPLH